MVDCKHLCAHTMLIFSDHKSKSSQPVRPYSTSDTLFLLFVQQTCQNIARITVFHLLTECMDGLFHKITEWGIKYGMIKTTEQLYFDKLTCEHNKKRNTLKMF